MRRRGFLEFLGGAAAGAAWPLAARSEQLPVIGWLSIRSQEGDHDWLRTFRQGLMEGGFVEEQNVRIEYRWAGNRNELLREFADDLASQRVTVIVAGGGTPTAIAAKEATKTIPVVFLISADPVRAGLVASFNRPGGNVTGIAGFTDVIIAKRLELLAELMSGDGVIGLLLNGSNPNSQNRISDIATAAGQLHRKVTVIQVNDVIDLEKQLAAAVENQVRGLIVQNDTLFLYHAKRIADLALGLMLPTIFEERESVEVGGLMSYGPNRSERLRKLGFYTALILKGESPSTLPVDQPTAFELTVNLRTATAIGLTLPSSFLARANAVIE